jgi:hypothetical protein
LPLLIHDVTGIFNQFLSQQGKILTCFRSINIFGKPHYCVLFLTKKNAERLTVDTSKKSIVDFADYGEILAQGEGEPTPELLQELKRVYIGESH